MVKLKILGMKLCTPPIFGREDRRKPKLQQTVRVILKPLSDPTNVIASDKQVWQLALIWCKVGFFDILSLIVKFPNFFLFYDI